LRPALPGISEGLHRDQRHSHRLCTVERETDSRSTHAPPQPSVPSYQSFRHQAASVAIPSGESAESLLTARPQEQHRETPRL